MGVEKVRKDDTARTFEFLFRFNRVWINSRLLLLLLIVTMHLIICYIFGFNVDLRTSFSGTCLVELRPIAPTDLDWTASGYIKINNKTFLYSDLGNVYRYRGINTMEFDTNTCGARNWKWFDTYDYDVPNNFFAFNPNCSGTNTQFEAYFSSQTANGSSILLGITVDDAMTHLYPTAISKLLEAGVNVTDLARRSMFAFVLQGGHPNKTIMIKHLSGITFITLSVEITISGT